jgi:hypothetical protein
MRPCSGNFISIYCSRPNLTGLKNSCVKSIIEAAGKENSKRRSERQTVDGGGGHFEDR